MKFKILKENLKNGLNIIERITSQSLTLPILNNVLISVEKNLLNLTTTNLEIGINYWTLIKKEKEGKITAPAKLLSNFIKFLPEKEITIETKNNILHIQCDNFKTQIKGQNSEEFPIIPKISKEKFLEINSSSFCDGLSVVAENAAVNKIRPEISGVYISFQSGQITFAATDSFRLAEKKISYKKENSKFFEGNKKYSLILPYQTVKELINIFSEKDEKIKIYFSPNQIMFELLMAEDPKQPQLQIVSRLIDGEYPNYQEIIPDKYETQIILEKNSFLNQLKTASLFSEKINEVKLKVNPDNKEIEIFSQNQDVGQNQSFLKGSVKGKKISASFNWKFLIDGLSNIKSSEVIFELNGQGGPGVLKPVGDASYLYVLMPIKSD